MRTFPSTESRYPHVTDRPGEQVTSCRWRNATAICPPELRNVRTCSCIMLRAAHTSALPHTHTLTHAAPARALRSVADPERSLLDGSPSWVRHIILEYLSEYRGSRALSYSRIFSRIYIAQAALKTRIQPSNERYSGKLTVSGAPMVKWWRRSNLALTQTDHPPKHAMISYARVRWH